MHPDSKELIPVTSSNRVLFMRYGYVRCLLQQAVRPDFGPAAERRHHYKREGVTAVRALDGSSRQRATTGAAQTLMKLAERTRSRCPVPVLQEALRYSVRPDKSVRIRRRRQAMSRCTVRLKTERAGTRSFMGSVRTRRVWTRPPNVGRLTCGEPPRAGDAMAARLPRLSSKNATRSASGMTSRISGAKRGFSPGSGKWAADRCWQELCGGRTSGRFPRSLSNSAQIVFRWCATR